METFYKPKFEEVYDIYKEYANNWFAKCKNLDYDSFLSEYNYVLYMSYFHFKSKNVNHFYEKFNAYFLKSLINMIKSFNKKDKNNNLKSIYAVPLKDDFNRFEVLDIDDICCGLNDKSITALKIEGYNAYEICEMLNISAREYRHISERVEENYKNRRKDFYYV